MIDSIIFKVHNLFENQALLKFLETNVDGKKTMIKMGDEKESIVKEVFIKRYYIDFATGNSYAQGYNGFVKSSNYNCAYYVNHQRDYVEFNLSLPKYYYGNNLVQLVDHFTDRNCMTYRNSNFWDLNKLHFEWLKTVFNAFLQKELFFSGSKSNIEITRIDLCFNLVFATKEDAFFYLNELRTVKKKRFSENSALITNYHSGVYFPSKDFTLKIYHKGTEFKKNDFNKVKKRFGLEAAKQIHHLANNVLRYEVEFRPGAMTDYFITSLKTERKEVYECYNYARQLSANGYLSLNGHKYNFDGNSNNPMSKEFTLMPPDVALSVKRGDLLRKKDIRFMLALPSGQSLKEIPLRDINQYGFKELFDESMFNILIERFKQVFLHFQVGNFDSLTMYNDAIRKNKEEKLRKEIAAKTGIDLYNRISESKLKIITQLLMDHSWDQIKAMGILSKSAFYRYKKFFKEIGLKNKNSTYSYNVDFTYRNYYNLISGSIPQLLPVIRLT
jgi:hypothetical protein